MSHRSTFCDGVVRRDFLRLGGASLFGLGLTLSDLLAGQARAAAVPTRRAHRDVSLIYLFLHGGLSTIDTWDMKPDAPAEFRGEFKPIRSNVPGIDLCEHLPRMAKVMDKVSLVRSFRHHNSDHGAADHYMLTGYFPQAGFNPGLTPNNQKPAHGSIIARKLGPRGSVPPYVCLPKLHPSCGSAYLGASASPFVIDADPNAPDFAVPDVAPLASLPASRLENRKKLLATVDRFHRSVEAEINTQARTVGVFQRKAFELMTSPAAKKAFDIHAESDKLRESYGRNTLGQSCLMARRLVEAGVRCVTIDHSNWDTHDANFATLKRQLLPWLDAGVSTLFTDLAERGLLGSTLVLITGEFGRTPRINKNAGRDHWGPAFTVALGGGGIKGGLVVGKSDARAERPAAEPYGPEDLSATLYHLMGIDPKEEFLTPEGRPVAIVNNGRLIRELV
jgi:uncharacterized protein (DUF1501 family)